MCVLPSYPWDERGIFSYIYSYYENPKKFKHSCRANIPVPWIRHGYCHLFLTITFSYGFFEDPVVHLMSCFVCWHVCMILNSGCETLTWYNQRLRCISFAIVTKLLTEQVFFWISLFLGALFFCWAFSVTLCDFRLLSKPGYLTFHIYAESNLSSWKSIWKAR